MYALLWHSVEHIPDRRRRERQRAGRGYMLYHARQEWSVECMHWLLDVHFGEDYCRVANRTIQQNLNMARKFVLNILRRYKTQSSSNQALSNIMLRCLLDNSYISEVLGKN